LGRIHCHLRYASSNGLRGFAFIEYETKSASRAALNSHRSDDRAARQADSWKYFSFSNSQYNHALKQLELLGHPQNYFFEKVIGKTHFSLNGFAVKYYLSRILYCFLLL